MTANVILSSSNQTKVVSIGTQGPAGATGATGPAGDAGPAGTDGWSPVFAVVADGERRVLQVSDWTGGTGTKPATGKYVGATGLVDLITDGADISSNDVSQYANLAAFPVTGAAGTLYIAADTGLVYRWNGSAYAAVGLQPIADQTILGNVSGATATPVALTKAQGQTLLDIGWVLQSRDAAAPNATIPAHALYVSGAEASLDFVLAPKGNGAIATNVPNNLASGGNKRGTKAVDLQLARAFAAQVASGSNSALLAGSGNTASGALSAVIAGSGHTISAGYSVVLGSISADISGTGYSGALAGDNPTISGARSASLAGKDLIVSGQEAFAAGYKSEATDQQTVAFGFTAKATGSRSSALGGENAIASGACSATLGGSSASASGFGAVVVGGLASSASHTYSVALGGYNVRTVCESEVALGLTTTNAGRSLFSLRKTIADNTTAPLTAAQNQTTTLAAGHTLAIWGDVNAWFKGYAIARQGTDYKVVEIKILASKSGTTYTILYQSFTTVTETAAMATHTITAVASSLGIELQATSPSGGGTAYWSAAIDGLAGY